jgi:type II secretion system protein H
MIATTSSCNSIRSGFTLIELLAVLVLAAILAGAAVLSLQGPYQAARLENAIERITLIDRQLREHARRYARPAQLAIHPSTGRTIATDLTSDKSSPTAFQLDSGVRIDQVAIGERRSNCDAMTIAYSAQGRSLSFGVCLCGSDGKQHWLLFTGGTGQVIQIEDETKVEELLCLGSTPGTDTD